jgi:murein L,D-transpeptidase YcbB/YkuD
MRRWQSAGIAVILLLFGLTGLMAADETPCAMTPPAGEAASLLYDFFDANRSYVIVEGRSVDLLHRKEICRFYADRRSLPAWSREGQLLVSSQELIQTLLQVGEHGLDPLNARYHLKELVLLNCMMSRLAPAPMYDLSSKMELLLSDAFMTLGYDLHHGLAYGRDINEIHHKVTAKKLDMPALLRDALRNGNIRATLEGLAPRTEGYQRLKKALAFYNECACLGGWVTDPEAYRDVALVKQRLQMSGEYLPKLGEDPESPETLLRYEEGVKTYQARHGLRIDGIVGPRTRRALAEPVEQKLERIRLNMERWRWFSPEVHEDYVMVNLPAFSLQLIEKGEAVLKMAVIIGREARKTPTMEATMRYLVFNPYWRVPMTILNEDVAPKAAADPDYFARKRIKIFHAEDTGERDPVDPKTIDWAHWSKNDAWRYTLRQDPGPYNALGYVKFIFPNEEDIYIHDTPHSEYFNNYRKMFSSGCIRAEKPIELAKKLLERGDPDITYKTIFERLVPGRRQTVLLDKPIHVYLTYQTAWADPEGKLHYCDDLYGYDTDLEALIGVLLH